MSSLSSSSEDEDCFDAGDVSVDGSDDAYDDDDSNA
jgi:hypothetical protein